MSSFQRVLDRATERKGGEQNLQKLLPNVLSEEELAALPDAYFLAWMTRCIFRSGFVWRIIDNKWSDFEEVFHQFNPETLIGLPEEEWEDFVLEKRIVRHSQKIQAVRRNAWFVHEHSIQYGSFGEFLAQWPGDQLVELFDYLKKNGSRLGGHTGQYFLQYVGKDTFALTADVVACLKAEGLEIADNPTSKRDFRKAQAMFDEWRAESGLPYYHLSLIAAYSVGSNEVLVD